MWVIEGSASPVQGFLLAALEPMSREPRRRCGRAAAAALLLSASMRASRSLLQIKASGSSAEDSIILVPDS